MTTTTIDAPVLELTKHGVTARMYQLPGKIGKRWSEGRYYEEPILERIWQLCREDPLIPKGIAIDAGANFGNHSLWMKLVCGIRRVVAFEPIQDEILMANLELNGLTSAEVPVCPSAAGASRGFAKQVGKGKLERIVGECRVEDVQVRIEAIDALAMGRKIDALAMGRKVFDGPVTLMKLDVEDMELEALIGARNVIMQDRPYIFAECHEGYRPGHDAIFRAMGYRFHGKPMKNNSILEWHPIGRE